MMAFGAGRDSVMVGFSQGRSSSNDAFSPVSDSSLFPINFSDSAENFPNLTFSPKNFDFHPPKYLTFFSHSPQISNFRPIPLFQFISSPISGNFSFPLFLQIFP